LLGKSIYKNDILGDSFGGQFEVILKNDNISKNVYGLKFGGQVNRKFFLLGYQLATFSDFEGFGLSFIPKFGLGYKYVFLTYNRNLSLWKNQLPDINRNNLSITAIFPLESR
jgi:hypothetical protein